VAWCLVKHRGNFAFTFTDITLHIRNDFSLYLVKHSLYRKPFQTKVVDLNVIHISCLFVRWAVFQEICKFDLNCSFAVPTDKISSLYAYFMQFLQRTQNKDIPSCNKSEPCWQDRKALKLSFHFNSYATYLTTLEELVRPSFGYFATSYQPLTSRSVEQILRTLICSGLPTVPRAYGILIWFVHFGKPMYHCLRWKVQLSHYLIKQHATKTYREWRYSSTHS